MTKIVSLKYIEAKLPFKKCQLRFMLKSRSSDELLKEPDVPLLEYKFKTDLNENLQIIQENLKRQIILYVLVISDTNRVVSIGWLPIDFAQNIKGCKKSLTGMVGQVGFIQFDIYDSKVGKNKNDQVIPQFEVNSQKDREQSSQQITLKKYQISEQFRGIKVETLPVQTKNVPRKYLPKNNNTPCLADVTLTSQDDIKDFFKEQEQFLKSKSMLPSANEQNLNLKINTSNNNIQSKMENSDQFLHDINEYIWRQKFINAEFRNVILQNQIFQLKNRNYIQYQT